MEVHHAVPSVTLAVYRGLAALEIRGRSLRARVVQASFVEDVNHAVLGMQLAVYGRLAAPDIIARTLHAGVM